MKKVLCALLSLLMLVPLISSCNKTPADTTSAVNGEVQTGDKEEIPELPSVKYDGQDIVTLTTGTLQYSDFDEKQNSGSYESVNAAIHQRNAELEDKYGIKFTNMVDFGTSFGDGPGFKKIQTDYNSNIAEYDICMLGIYDAAQLALGLYIADINSMPYIDLEKSYWDQKVNEQLAINGVVYYTTGDISFIDNICTHMIMFNKDMFKTLNLESPYSLVDNNQWTFDTFSEYVKKGSAELDGDGQMTELDQYGLLTWNDVIHQAFFSSTNKFCSINDRGYMSLTVYNPTTVALMDDYTNLLFNEELTFNYSKRVADKKQWDSTRKAMFDNNQALFYATLFTTVPKHRDSMVDFGIIPYPKYTETQENYGHFISATHAQMMCIEALHTDEEFEMISVIVEDMAYLSKKYVTPAYYDETLIGKNVRDSESAAMLDIIFASRVYDVGVYYKIGANGSTIHANLTNIMASGSNNFTSRYQGFEEGANKMIGEINLQFEQVGKQ